MVADDGEGVGIRGGAYLREVAPAIGLPHGQRICRAARALAGGIVEILDAAQGIVG